FLNPPRMLEAIATQLNETDQVMPSEPAAVAKSDLDSLASRYAAALRTNESADSRRANHRWRQSERLSEPGDSERHRLDCFGWAGRSHRDRQCDGAGNCGRAVSFVDRGATIRCA